MKEDIGKFSRSSSLQSKGKKKRLEEASLLSVDRCPTILESVIDGAYQTTPEGRLITVNSALVRMLGYDSKQELLKMNVTLDLCANPEERRILIQKMNQESELRDFELKLKRKDGQYITVFENAHVVKDEYGHVLYYEGILRDITDRKRSEEALSALNYYGAKLNSARTLQEVYEITLDAAKQTLGFTYAAFFVPQKGKLKTVCQRGYPEILHIELPLNGTRKGITVKAAKIHKPILIPNVKESEDYFKGVPDMLSELAVPVETDDKLFGVLDVESKQVNAFNEKDATLLQILASHSATAISNLVKRAEIEKSSNQLASLMKSSAEMIRTKDLRQRLKKIAEAITDLGWRRAVIRVTNCDMETTSIEDIVTAGLSEEERNYLWANKLPGQVWRERFGHEYERYKIGEFYHLPWSDPWVRKRFSQGTIPSRLSEEEMVDWDPQDLLYAQLKLADGRPVGIVSIDDPIDGKRPTIESLAPLELFLHQAAVAIENARLIKQLDDARTQIEEYAQHLEDKVEKRTRQVKEAHVKLVKSERLAAIGQVAAMVGHDLRNPLTGILGATYYLKTKLASKMNERTKEMLELIEKNVQYSNKIISDLIEYSTEIRLELSKANAKSIIKEALALIETPKNIRIVDLTQQEAQIEIDREKMKRAFVNIMKNAFEAMPEGGIFTIESKEADGNLEITFTDTGPGMPEKVIEKIWTPFVTTKAKGMGLGLSVCKRIIEAHGGKISVRSIKGKGTTLGITVPKRQKSSDDLHVALNPLIHLLSKTRETC